MDTEVSITVDELLSRISGLESMIREASGEAESNRQLSSHVADALREAGCYRMFRPRSRGGLDFDPVSGFRVIEELARIDSAAGWNVAIANASEPFGAWFSDAATEKVFGPADSVLCGAFNPPRRAVPVDGGYQVSGRCSFNSNCTAANWNLGLAHIYDGETERLDENGVPETLIVLIPMDEMEIINNWDTLGMRGTGSHDVNVDDVFVPAERAVPFVPDFEPSSAYNGPFHLLTVWPPVACNAVSALGVAQAAIDEFVELATKKIPAYTERTVRDKDVTQFRFAKARARLESARAYLHETFDNAWQRALDGKALAMEDRATLQLSATNVVIASAESVDLIHSLVGASGIRNNNKFQRYFRDAHVITQHGFVCESRLEAVGQVNLGLDPTWPFFYF